MLPGPTPFLLASRFQAVMLVDLLHPWCRSYRIRPNLLVNCLLSRQGQTALLVDVAAVWETGPLHLPTILHNVADQASAARCEPCLG